LDKDRLVSAVLAEDDASFELKLRPRFLREFVGQKKVKDNLSIAVEAAKSRGEALDHVLLYGPPGLGKTTLATIIANEMGVAYQQSAGPAIQIKGDLTAILTNLTDRQVLFLDEVHRLQPALEEILYSALEDYKLDIIIGQGPSARTHTIDIRPFTFVAATTRAGLLSAPLRSRFGILLRLEFYTAEELKFIIERSAEIMGVEIDPEGAAELAGRARGTPRRPVGGGRGNTAGRPRAARRPSRAGGDADPALARVLPAARGASPHGHHAAGADRAAGRLTSVVGHARSRRPRVT